MTHAFFGFSLPFLFTSSFLMLKPFLLSLQIIRKYSLEDLESRLCLLTCLYSMCTESLKVLHWMNICYACRSQSQFRVQSSVPTKSLLALTVWLKSKLNYWPLKFGVQFSIYVYLKYNGVKSEIKVSKVICNSQS